MLNISLAVPHYGFIWSKYGYHSCRTLSWNNVRDKTELADGQRLPVSNLTIDAQSGELHFTKIGTNIISNKIIMLITKGNGSCIHVMLKRKLTYHAYEPRNAAVIIQWRFRTHWLKPTTLDNWGTSTSEGYYENTKARSYARGAHQDNATAPSNSLWMWVLGAGKEVGCLKILQTSQEPRMQPVVQKC